MIQEENIKPEQEQPMTTPEVAQNEGPHEEEQTGGEEPLEKKYNEEIVQVVRGGKPRPTKVLNVPIEWEGQEEVVQIKKLSYGERAEFSEKFVSIQMQGEFQKVDLLMAEMQIQGLIYSLHKAPFPTTDDYIRYELDGPLGEYLNSIAEKYNKLDEKTKKK